MVTDGRSSASVIGNNSQVRYVLIPDPHANMNQCVQLVCTCQLSDGVSYPNFAPFQC